MGEKSCFKKEAWVGNFFTEVFIFKCSIGGISCSVDTYAVGGTITGLTGTVVLQNNSGDDLTLTTNDPFTFSTHLADPSDYSVTVLTQPAGKTCTPSNNTGTLNGADVTDNDYLCCKSGLLDFSDGVSKSILLKSKGAQSCPPFKSLVPSDFRTSDLVLLQA